MVTFEPLLPIDPLFLNLPPANTPVLIIGGGPVGLFASLLLAKRNIRSAILERHRSRTGQPKAHAINPRSLEIFRQAGLDVRTLRKMGSSAEDARWVRFVTVLQGTAIGDLLYERQDEGVKEVTSEPLMNISQKILEEFLQQEVLKTGLVSIHRRFEWQSYTLDAENNLRSCVVNRDTSEILQITSKYMLGTDGTESSVRGQMEGVEWAGLPGYSAERRWYVSIHARGDIRSVLKPLDRYGQLFFCFHPKHKNGIIVYDLSSSWVYARKVDPKKEPIQFFTRERCRELIDPCVGPGVKYDVASVNVWYTDPRIASSYATHDLRVFLAGDSAHSFPPQGGLGINTGIADVHNLIWKLAAAIEDNVPNPRSLLSTYSTERIPVARANALQSFVNETRWESLLATAENAVSDISPNDDAAIDAEYLKPNVRGPVVDAINFNRSHFDSLALQLGYVYGEGDGTELLPECSIFRPKAKPGSRLPHAWVASNLSILDLVSKDTFTLFASRASNLTQPTYEVAGMTVYITYICVDDLGVKEWKDLVGLQNGGGILVRPDQHILGMANSAHDVLQLLFSYLN